MGTVVWYSNQSINLMESIGYVGGLLLLRKYRLGIISLFFCFLMVGLAGCQFGSSTEEKMYDHLEETVALEEQFREQQKPLAEAEKKEQDIYNEIVALSMDEFDKIEKLSKEAEENTDKRLEYLKKEKESIDEAYEEFEEIKELSEDLEGNVKEDANMLIDKMDKRYNAYKKLHSEYEAGVKEDKELYSSLQDKELTLEQLQDQIKAINEQYSKVAEQKDAFNKYTSEFNDAKKEFYKSAELDVNYGE